MNHFRNAMYQWGQCLHELGRDGEAIDQMTAFELEPFRADETWEIFADCEPVRTESCERPR
eukprot:SAG22_NODE_218_length_14885_cov_24.733699_2_plen_61_part_00